MFKKGYHFVEKVIQPGFLSEVPYTVDWKAALDKDDLSKQSLKVLKTLKSEEVCETSGVCLIW